MKSFRLDSDSVDEWVEGWPFFIVAAIAGLLIGWFATTNEWARVLVPIVFGVALGPRIVGQLRRKYPTAMRLWLLAVGILTCLVGITVRMAFPAWQGTRFDATWLGIAFFAVLAFVVINRKNPDVVK